MKEIIVFKPLKLPPHYRQIFILSTKKLILFLFPSMGVDIHFKSRKRIVMDLKESLAPFRPAETRTSRSDAATLACIRVAILTERHDLKAAMMPILQSSRYRLTQVRSIALAEKAMKKTLCDIVIVDVERQDTWPASVFAQFDDAAASFPVIIVCKRTRDIPAYVQRARHAIAVISYETIGDLRLLSLIDVALFRAELTEKIGIGSGWD